MTHLEFLKDTKDFYSKNPRGIDEDSCKYLTVKGNKCAIGRFIDFDKFKLDNNEHFSEIIRLNKECLPEWMLELNPSFLTELQMFHDRNQNWNDCGLTIEGYKTYNYLSELAERLDCASSRKRLITEPDEAYNYLLDHLNNKKCSN